MGQTTVYSYYANGLLQSITDAKGQVTTYTYDAGNRLTAIAYADSKSDTFGYDAVGNLTNWSGADGVTGSATYDALKRKLNETVNSGGFSKTIAYSYDAYGNKATYTSPEGIEHVYGYDKLGRPTTLTFSGKTVSLTYEKIRLKSIGYPNGVNTSYSYNANHWLTGIATVGSQGTVLSRGYSFDDVGNITGKESEHGPTSYGYDATYQLTSADHPTLADEAFGYDQVGNRLSSRDVTGALSYNANNELIGHSSVSYEYGANQYFDAETGEHYNFQRTYEPETGRYTQVDPIGFAGGDVNLYEYVQNNPIIFVDPYGLAVSDILPGIITAISRGTQAGAYAVGQAGNAIADIATNGPPAAQAALAFAGATVVAPLAVVVAPEAAGASAPAITGFIYKMTTMSPGKPTLQTVKNMCGF